MDQVLTGKLQTWTLNKDNPSAGRKFIITNTNFNVANKYFDLDVYNPFTKTGSQRIARERHKNKLKNAISNDQYTPQVLNVAVKNLSQVNVDDKGNVTISLSEGEKLLVLDGGTRFRALKELRSENSTETARHIDNLPVPVLVYLDNNHQVDFLNLNAGQNVDRSHILSVSIANNRLAGESSRFISKAESLACSLHIDEKSPFKNKVKFGHDGDGQLALTVLCNHHASMVISTLYGSVKILEVLGNDENYFIDLFNRFYKIVSENTECAKPKKLLALPPDGPKGNVHNWLSVINITMYYLYLQREVDRSDRLEDYQDHILKCLEIYNNLVAGDVSKNRRKTLSLAYAQKLFNGMDEDLVFDDLGCPFHMGLPLGLLTVTHFSSFGVDNPGKPIIKTNVKDYVESVDDNKLPSDTDEMWED